MPGRLAYVGVASTIFLSGGAFLTLQYPAFVPPHDILLACSLVAYAILGNLLVLSRAGRSFSRPKKFKNLSPNLPVMRAFLGVSMLVSLALPWTAVAAALWTKTAPPPPGLPFLVRNLALFHAQLVLETVTNVPYFTRSIRCTVPLVLVPYRLPVLYQWVTARGMGAGMRTLARVNFAHWAAAYFLFFLPFVFPSNFVEPGVGENRGAD